jgi:Ca2+-binding EF-hand superfamily protein
MKPWILATLLIATPCFAVDQKVDVKKQQAEQKARFDQAFKNVDSNGDGKISKEEAEQKAPPLAANFAILDTNKDGGLTNQEIWDVQQKVMAAERQARQDFSSSLQKADKNKDGKLSKQEAQALPKLGENFEQIDNNHDGFLVMPEILGYLQQQAQSRASAAPSSAVTPSTGK